jgi:hypothetical protein
MAGFSNDTNNQDVVFADNVDFSGGATPTGKMTTNGQLLIGSTATPHIKVGTLGSLDGSITWTVGSGTITGQVTGGTSVLKTLTGNSGGAISPTAGNINIVTANSTNKFVGSGSTLTEDFGLSNLVLGSSLPSITTGDFNVGLGYHALHALAAGNNNTAIGYEALATASLVAAGNNVAIGYHALNQSVGGGNVAIGKDCMVAATSAQANVCVGSGAANSLLTGDHNFCLGVSAGSALTSSESNNILINSPGVTAESNAIRIGEQGTGTGQQNQCYLAGVLNTVSGRVIKITTPGAYPYTTLITDHFIKVDTSAARTIIPMAAPVTGTLYIIKDTVGSAATFNITITPSGKNIDGAASYVINSNYGSITIVYNGAEWSII